MKVLVFSTVFPSNARPVHGLFVFERIRHAARRAEVRVVAPAEWFRRPLGSPKSAVRDTLEIDMPTFFYIPGLFKCLDGLFLFLSSLLCVRRIRRSFDFDVIDSHFGFPDGVAAVMLGWWFQRPVVVTLRGSEAVLASHVLRRRAIAWALRRASRIIAVSVPLASLAKELGAAEDRIVVIENGVDTTRFCLRPRSAARLDLQVSGMADSDIEMAAPLLVSIGHLVPGKGFHRVIGLLPQLVDQLPGLRYVIIGGSAASSGNYPLKLRRLVDKLRLTDRVVLAGVQSPEQVATWLNAADLFVLPTEREGSPNVIWESLACGLPVVATRVGEIERMIPPYAGMLLESRDDDEKLRECLLAALRTNWDRERIRAHAATHTWDEVAGKVVQQWSLLAPAPIQTPAVCGQS